MLNYSKKFNIRIKSHILYLTQHRHQLGVEVDLDEFRLLVAVDERLVEVERACLVDAGDPFLVDLLIPPAHRDMQWSKSS